MKASYPIEVECANCANKMEIAAGKIAGVKSVRVNFLLQKIVVEFAEGSEPNAVMKEIERVCRRVEPECEIDY